jgi:hypothetical protein
MVAEVPKKQPAMPAMRGGGRGLEDGVLYARPLR